MLVLLGLLACTLVSGAVDKDEILSLPGWNRQLPSKQYSGYLTVGSKHLHYWLILSERNPANDPVVVWLNGGPGCSSLDGLIYEHGPLRVNESDYTQLIRFEHNWATMANMLYIEAPVGVGFSYSDRGATDYRTNDDITAADNLAGLAKFFELYPEFKQNRFFITGESYAGIYVPTLAEAIMWADKNGTWAGPTLRGIAVGNGCIGNKVGVCGGQRDIYETQYLLGQAFIPQQLKDRIIATCDFQRGFNATCRTLTSQMSTTIGHVNIYNIFGDCISGRLAGKGAGQHKVPMTEPSAFGPDACIDSHAASAYFNRVDVMDAIHVVKPPFVWAVCANQIQYTSTRANLPRDTYPALLQYTDVLIYNGDWDACVPYTDNEAWTSGMGYPVERAWHAWTYDTTQVGGYATAYRTGAKSFTFATVRGGRHEVPETAPRQALEMFRRFLTGTPF